MADSQRKANFILKNAEQYAADKDFRFMVDNTVYLSQEEREQSILRIEYGEPERGETCQKQKRSTLVSH
jgi:hypothetical protein